MSLLSFNFESQYLAGSTQISVILPDKTRNIMPEEYYRSGKRYPVLWLLHGSFGDNTDWIRRTSIELYASRKNLIVVMPSALNSGYSNWPNVMAGYNMYDYLIKELMPLVYGWFPASDRREDNFIAGLSMGGRGAIKYAVNHPELFAAAAILSAAPSEYDEINAPAQHNSKDTAGSDISAGNTKNVLQIIHDSVKSRRQLPRLMFGCGEADEFMYKDYLRFRRYCNSIGLEACWFHLPGYKHEWAFWDLAIQHALNFFGLPDDSENPF